MTTVALVSLDLLTTIYEVATFSISGMAHIPYSACLGQELPSPFRRTAAKRAAGQEMMMVIWSIVTHDLESEHAGDPQGDVAFSRLRHVEEKDRTEVRAAAAEIVNTLLEGCKENERLFSTCRSLQDELYVFPR
jgi:hypothetical protein